MSDHVLWQPSLFAQSGASTEAVDVDRAFSSLARVQLDAESWVDRAPGWAVGSDALFEELLTTLPWGQRTRRMFDNRVVEPRLTASWSANGDDPPLAGALDLMRRTLSAHYGVRFDSAGFNLYRDGRDSVAWHGDRIAPDIDEPIVALVSVGEPRSFLLRPKGGGRSRRFLLGGGDLLVTGGRCQRTWEHSVPKLASAGPRISIAFRHGAYRAGAPSG